MDKENIITVFCIRSSNRNNEVELPSKTLKDLTEIPVCVGCKDKEHLSAVSYYQSLVGFENRRREYDPTHEHNDCCFSENHSTYVVRRKTTVFKDHPMWLPKYEVLDCFCSCETTVKNLNET